MLLSYLILLGLLFVFSMLAFLKKVHFRVYNIPARICYGLLLVNEIFLSMGLWRQSSWVSIVMLVVSLFLIGLLETGFRNKLQNRLSKQLLWLIGFVFIIILILALLMIK